ncbi:MAG TPA: hypothetical protein VE981_05440, partial [Planctomycetota bacterium]|nr:hypothetical protein [Planctomycetota bacterium]
MGRAITYCVQCSKRVSDADLSSGKAFRVGDRILCDGCTPDAIKIKSSTKVTRPRDAITTVLKKP